MTENQIGVLLGVVIGVLLVAIIVVVFRWLWNTTMPEVFGVRDVTFWQAFKILLLAGILFGSHRVVEVPRQVSVDPEPIAARSE